MKPEDILIWKDEALAAIGQAESADELEAIRIANLGRKGKIQDIMAALKTAEPADKRAFGQSSNEFKRGITDALEAKKAERDAAAGPSGPFFDVTLPGMQPPQGSQHLIHQITDRVVDVFTRIGFTVAEGPDIETVEHNFDALNTPADHPSRDEQDTFYLDDGRLLRTHTSPVQVRYMKANPPPIRIVAPGRAYRRDTPDATHTATFHQIEGLYVAEKVSLADLKGDLTYFAREILGPGVDVRFRPHFFPFTEPSVEVDFSCPFCKDGCRVCKHSKWIEIAGAGLVDPHVLASVGYDPDAVTGYAFGMGIERIGMILHQIDDIRRLYDNQVAFLHQF